MIAFLRIWKLSWRWFFKGITYLLILTSVTMVVFSTFILFEDEPNQVQMVEECRSDHGQEATRSTINGCVEDYFKAVGVAETLMYTGYLIGMPIIIFFVLRKVSRLRKESSVNNSGA